MNRKPMAHLPRDPRAPSRSDFLNLLGLIVVAIVFIGMTAR